jgi:hypothetical protein
VTADFLQVPPEVIAAAHLLLEWAGPTKAWSVMGIGVSDHGELQQLLSEQLIVNVNLRTELAAESAGRVVNSELQAKEIERRDAEIAAVRKDLEKVCKYCHELAEIARASLERKP